MTTYTRSCFAIIGTFISFFVAVNASLAKDAVQGDPIAWHPLSVRFEGTNASETDSDPNPFLDFRLQVEFKGPSGQTYSVPGYFDGDGEGGESGNVWRVQFAPDEGGNWTYQASFRSGKEVAVSLEADAGQPAAFDGEQGSFEVAQRDPNAPGFLKWGRLEYVGKHYLKFRDGSYWIRGGVDSPENFLAYAGFDNTPPSHHYTDHVEDWNEGDPDWNEGKGKAIIGALNDLASRKINSVYFLTMNIGGDGGDVWPWAGKPKRKGDPSDDNLHFDISKLRQWETVFTHAQRRGINLHFVFNEAETENKKELDNGDLGVERKLYYREIIARFGHHSALSWNLCEEYNLGFNLGPDRIRAYAGFVQATDPYKHPITVHSAGNPLNELRFTFGDPRFSLTSIQLNQSRIDKLVEDFRSATAAADRPLPVSMDEFTVDAGQNASWKPVDRPDLHRKQKLWPTYLSGGQIEFILDSLLGTDSFKTSNRQALWKSVGIARTFMEENLPFWEMSPADALVDGEATLKVGSGSRRSFDLGAQVFQKPDVVYAIYFPTASNTGRLDLSGASGEFQVRWFNPRTGEFEGPVSMQTAGDWVEPGVPPADPDEDWVLLLNRGDSEHADHRPNVLFISVDDLNDWVGCLGGHPQAKTPNIDRVAEMGTLFTNAQCQSPVCSPSRASMMTGRYPHTTGLYFLSPDLKQAPALEGVLTMPEAFAASGYKTMAAGKIFHGGDARFFQQYQPTGGFGPSPDKKISQPHGHALWDWGAYPDSDDQMPDIKAANWAVEQLSLDHDTPFFMGVGFYRPHVPMCVPQKWFDMHPREQVKLPLVREDDREDLSHYAIDLTNLKHVSPTHQWMTGADQWQHAVQSYLASVTFADNCVGMVIEALESSKYAENTIIVLYSDHGFHLGEKQRWAKRSLWEDGTRVPLVISAPGLQPDQRTSQPAELIDVFPTLLELAGMKSDERQEGQSLVPLMKDPNCQWNHPAITSFGPGNFAIRSARFRFIQYFDGSRELYDLQADPHEWTNLASDPEYANTIAELASLLPREQHPVLPGDSTGHQAYAAANHNINVRVTNPTKNFPEKRSVRE